MQVFKTSKTKSKKTPPTEIKQSLENVTFQIGVQVNSCQHPLQRIVAVSIHYEKWNVVMTSDAGF